MSKENAARHARKSWESSLSYMPPTDEAFETGFLAGFSAATADTEARVREAIRLTIEEAEKAATHPSALDTPEGQSWRLWVEGGGNEHINGRQEVKDYQSVKQLISAIDREVILQRVM